MRDLFYLYFLKFYNYLSASFYFVSSTFFFFFFDYCLRIFYSFFTLLTAYFFSDLFRFHVILTLSSFLEILSFVFVPLLLSVAFLTLVERKVLASVFHKRVGPNA